MPVYKTNTAANTAVTEKDNLYQKVPQGTSLRARVLPALNKKGLITFKQVLHFKMKNPDGDGDRGIAPGCTKFHGNTKKCLFCDAFDLFALSKDKAESELGTNWKTWIKASEKVYIPALVNTAGPDKKWDEYSTPKLLALAPTGGTAFNEANSRMEDNGLNALNDEAKGQAVIFSNPKTAGKYTVDTTSLQVPLSKIAPDWLSQAEGMGFGDVYKVLDTRIYTREEQEVVLRHSFPHLDWDAIMKELG